MSFDVPCFTRKIRLFFWLMCLLFSSGLYSHRPDLRFQHFTNEHGLAQSSVYCILQDQKGFMWFGTQHGLNRFDGRQFVVYKFQHDNPNSLNNSYILSLYQDSSGTLWIGTKGGGLNAFDPGTHRFTHYLADPESFDSPSNIINAIFEDDPGELWIGTGGGGLKQFDRKKKAFIHFPVNPGNADSLSHNTINAIYEDNSGSLWIGTDGGLKQFDRENNQIIPSPFFPARKVLAIYEGNTGGPWVGTEKGFYKFEHPAGTGQFVHYQILADRKHFAGANTIRTFYRDHSGTFWIGTDYGLHIFDRQDKTYHSYYADTKDPHSLSINSVQAIYEDESGALWVGVVSGALNKLNRTRQAFNHYYGNPVNPESLSNLQVFAIHEDREGVLWIGAYNQGLNAFNRETGELVSYRNQPGNPNSLSDNKIWAICEDRQGAMWIGTAGGGLNQFNRKTAAFTRYRHQPQNPNSLSNDVISCIIEDQQGILWIATNGGLNKFDPQRKQFFRYQTNPGNQNTLVHNLIYILHEDHRGMLWIGTQRGLSIFDPKRETFTSYRINHQDPGSLIQHPVYSICEDGQGIIWLGTSGGLYKFDRERDIISSYTEKDGLPNDVIYGILEDDQGNLWFSTNKGLSKFDPRTKKFKNYSVVDGLQSYEFCGGAYYKSRRGELFFGGINGFNAFFPDAIKDNPYIPPVVITDFKIFNQPVFTGRKYKGRLILEKSIEATEAITLSHRHNTFSFEYAALNYNHSEKNEYAYMMEGIEKSWNYVGPRRFVTYANLAPGNYTFRVKASNNHGVWNEEGVSLRIRVLSPFWVTWWFRLSLFIFVVFLALFTYKVRVDSISRRKKELEDIVARRTTELRESGEKYRTVVERAHSGIAIIQDDVIVFKNAPFDKLLGYDDQDITDQPLIQFVAPKKQADMNTLLALSRKEEKLAGTVETILRNKEGGSINVEVNYRSIQYRRQPALLMFFHDIRMQKLLEEERLKTARLESTRILARGIAHDFNNLLATILGNIELALGDVISGDGTHKVLSGAIQSTLKAVDLIRQFIDLAKDDVPIKKTEFIQGIIKDVVHSVLKGSGVTCRFDLPENLWPVDCNGSQIKQAIKNIVTNSKQAMPDNGMLEIKAVNEELAADQVPDKAPGKYVCIYIKDNGTGIPGEDLPRIFDPYFSTRPEVTLKGLGLGLSVVHSIIKKHDGIIQVTSEVGVGTTVRICLPAAAS